MIYYKKTEISNAQVLTLADTPVTLIDAVANKIAYCFVGVIDVLNVTTPYNNENLKIAIQGQLFYFIFLEALKSTVDRSVIASQFVSINPTNQFLVNTPTVIYTDANPVNGDGNLVVHTYYTLFEL